MKLLDVVHPAAKTLVDISLSQDAEVGMCVRACAFVQWTGCQENKVHGWMLGWLVVRLSG